MSLRKATSLAATMLAIALAGTACMEREPTRVRMPDASAEQGRQLIAARGCGACHTIPGVTAADGVVGPPLTAWSRHTYIAGKYPNKPAVLVQWLLEPHALAPATAMPDLGLTPAEAGHVAAYLYELR